MRHIANILVLIILVLPTNSFAENNSLNRTIFRTQTDWNFDGMKAVSAAGPYCVLSPRPHGCGIDCFKDNGGTTYDKKLVNELEGDLVSTFKEDLERAQRQYNTVGFRAEHLQFEKRTTEIFRKILERIEEQFVKDKTTF